MHAVAKTSLGSFTVLSLLLAACGRLPSPAADSQARADTPVAPTAVTFAPPVKVLPDLGYGYEPTVVVDHAGNIYHTSHKENWQLALAPDPDSPTATRSMSWARVSVDNGVTWKDTPGLTALALENHLAGDEGDMAVDDAGHVYLVDTYLGDNTLTRWTVSGRDQIAFDFSNAAIPSAETLDDRPWITAHGDGHVFYMGNNGVNNDTPLAEGNGSGFGPGRYTVYASYDGGQTFPPIGYPLKGSYWCRPATDHSAGAHYVYVVCTNGSNLLWSYVSTDDGRSFERYDIGKYAEGGGPVGSYPLVEVAPDGSVYVVKVQAAKGGNKLVLYRSTDHGQTWSTQDITPEPGRYMHLWLASSRDGKLGFGVYHRKSTQDPWYVYGAIWTPGEIPQLVSLDPQHPVGPATTDDVGGDYLGSYFGPDGHLNVVWDRASEVPASRDIWFARSQ